MNNIIKDKFNKVSAIKRELDNPYATMEETETTKRSDFEHIANISIKVKNKFVDKKVPLTVSITRSNEEYLDNLSKAGTRKSEFVNALITLAKEDKIRIEIKDNNLIKNHYIEQ